MLDTDPDILAWQDNVRACNACTARTEAEIPVPGYGERKDIIFMGRNPGAREDQTGLPFQGPSGVIFNTFLAACGLTRADIFITNLILCHTEDDRAPTRPEISTCMRMHMRRELEILKPFLIVTLGAETSKSLLGVDKISKRHGNLIFNAYGFWGIPCYHPGSVTYDSSKQAELDYDATQIKRFLAREKYYRRKLAVRMMVRRVAANRRGTSV